MLSVLSPPRVAAQARLLAAITHGEDGTYFDALRTIQRRFPMGSHGNDCPRLLFDLDEIAQSFLTCVLAESQLPLLPIGRLSPILESRARELVFEALQLLESYDPEMPTNVRQLIGTLLFAQVEGCAGGSSSDALGTVWVSPRDEWTAVRYAECLCHELVHQALFLEDMLFPIFKNTAEEPMIVSSIRRCKRPYESSFHSAVVTGALIEMYVAMGLQTLAEEFFEGLSASVVAFEAMPQHLTTRGLEILDELSQIIYSCNRSASHLLE